MKALREIRGIALLNFLTSALEGGEGSAWRPGGFLPPGKTRYPLYRRLGEPQGRAGRRKISPTGVFFCTMILYWSRYRLYICQSILSRQSFAGFMSRYLAAGAVASDASCLTIGPSSLCFFPSSSSSSYYYYYYSSWDGAVCCVIPM